MTKDCIDKLARVAKDVRRGAYCCGSKAMYRAFDIALEGLDAIGTDWSRDMAMTAVFGPQDEDVDRFPASKQERNICSMAQMVSEEAMSLEWSCPQCAESSVTFEREFDAIDEEFGDEC